MFLGTLQNRTAADVARVAGAAIVFLIGLVLAGGLQAWAADGSLDGTFGSGGRVVIQVAQQQRDFARSVAVQPDGKILIAAELGEFTADTNSVVLIRLNENGTLDQSFGTGGKAINPGQKHARAIAIQPDGKILVAGATQSIGITFDFAVVRYNADGSVDQTFGDHGVASNGTGDPRWLLLQPDGRIIVIGSFIIFRNGSDYLLARFNSNGLPDPSFGTGGLVQTSFTTGLHSGDDALSAALQADGKIVVTGAATCISPTMIRYNENGSTDGTFGLNGTVLTPSFGAVANRIGIQTDGKIVVGGGNFVAGRYDPNGVPDASFGNQGIANGGVNVQGGAIYGIAFHPDGKILLGGSAQVGSVSDTAFALERLTADGALDGTFGNGGLVITNFTGAIDQAFAMTPQGKSRVILAGYAAEPGASYHDVAAARYLTGLTIRRE